MGVHQRRSCARWIVAGQTDKSQPEDTLRSPVGRWMSRRSQPPIIFWLNDSKKKIHLFCVYFITLGLFFPFKYPFFGNCLFVRVMDTVPSVWTQPTRRYDGLKFTSSDRLIFRDYPQFVNVKNRLSKCSPICVCVCVWFHPFWRIDYGGGKRNILSFPPAGRGNDELSKTSWIIG